MKGPASTIDLSIVIFNYFKVALQLSFQKRRQILNECASFDNF